METLLLTTPTLPLIRGLLDVFHRNDIMYCHWKSNEHLAATMKGTADLDLLFDASQRTAVEKLLIGFGFKSFVSVAEKRYRDIEDFIGLDQELGKVVHVHAHFKLTLGENYLKSYQLNLEQKLLESRVFDEEFLIYRSSPAFELVLLYFRQALKLRNRDLLKLSFGRALECRPSILKEYHWLMKRCTMQEVGDLLQSLFADSRPIFDLVSSELNNSTLGKLARLLKVRLKDQRLYSPFRATVMRWYRAIALKIFRKWSVISGLPVVTSRTHAREGFIVAMIGADGSGKSTVINAIQHIFKKKIDVYHIYMGRGKSGAASWKRAMLRLFRKKYEAIKKPAAKKYTSSHSTVRNVTFRLKLFNCLEALIIAQEKKSKIRKMRAAKAKGMLVVCDRFPQNQFMGYNDGPVLSALLHSRNFFFRWCAAKEARAYDITDLNMPDMVFKFMASATVLSVRKPGIGALETLEQKIDGIRRLQFRGQCRVVDIDANQPLEAVMKEVNHHLWSEWN